MTFFNGLLLGFLRHYPGTVLRFDSTSGLWTAVEGKPYRLQNRWEQKSNFFNIYSEKAHYMTLFNMFNGKSVFIGCFQRSKT
jgi:hypothetical protein